MQHAVENLTLDQDKKIKDLPSRRNHANKELAHHHIIALNNSPMQRVVENLTLDEDKKNKDLPSRRKLANKELAHQHIITLANYFDT